MYDRHYHDDRDRVANEYRDHHTTGPTGPTRDEIIDALETLLENAPTETPAVRTVRTLEAADMLPVTIEDRRIVRADIERGQPQRGELRSDDHISDYEIEYDDHCPECGRQTRHRHEYHSHHFIAGNMFTRCEECGTEHESDEWY